MRAKTIPPKRLTTEELRVKEILKLFLYPRPKTRAECVNGFRPCPWVGCKYHLYIDVNNVLGSIKLNFPDLEPWEIPVTCSLDVAEMDGMKLEEIGDIMNITRERVRQIELKAISKVVMAMREFI